MEMDDLRSDVERIVSAYRRDVSFAVLFAHVWKQLPRDLIETRRAMGEVEFRDHLCVLVHRIVRAWRRHKMPFERFASV